MNDFLKSLRAKDKERRQERNQNSRRYHTNGNAQQGTHGNYPPNPQHANKNNGNATAVLSGELEKVFAVQNESLPQISALLESIATSQRRIADAEERRADATEMISKALENFTDRFVEGDFGGDYQVRPMLPLPTLSPEGESQLAQRQFARANREEVINTIRVMRDKGATYQMVASHLEEMSIPTFSGKGKWHAQTIHRLCREFEGD